MGRLLKFLCALLLPAALSSCLLTPGKFASTLRIDADRHFAFTYTGQVYALDLDELGSSFGKGLSSMGKAGAAPKPQDKADAAERQAKADATNRAVADALGKEAGYRRVVYAGNNRFDIDYQTSGTLDHAFVFPYNLDAEVVFPFVVVEVRADGAVRVKAPGFSRDGGKGDALPGAVDGATKLDGSFTLDTDATIVSQNDEAGAHPAPGGRQTVTWTVTPLSKDAPTAVLRLGGR